VDTTTERDAGDQRAIDQEGKQSAGGIVDGGRPESDNEMPSQTHQRRAHASLEGIPSEQSAGVALENSHRFNAVEPGNNSGAQRVQRAADQSGR
jgi:hypothetical protein